MPNLAGVWSPGKSKDEIAKLVDTQAARIDIGRGNYSDYRWVDQGFGATLLDHGIFENGPQPVFSADDRYVLWLDGEIHNVGELQIPDFDTSAKKAPEVCLKLIHAKGREAFKDLKGLYIIVLYDRVSRRLTIVSGRYAFRPLFYKFCNGQFIFGSEIKAVRAADPDPAAVDSTALLEQFVYGSHFRNRIWLKDYFRVPPSSILTVDESGPKIQPFWIYKYDESAPRLDLHTYATYSAVLLDRAVERAMKGSHRIGMMLSGGYDSRAVAAAVRPWHKPFPAFTFGLPESRDVRYAAMLADRLGLQHFALNDPGPYLHNNAKAIVWRTEGLLPFSETTSIRYHHLFKQYADIILTGFLGEFSGSHTWLALLKARNRRDAKAAIYDRFITQRMGAAKRLFQPDAFARGLEELRTRFDESIEAVPNDHPLDMCDAWNYTNLQTMGTWSAPAVDRYLFENRSPLTDHDYVDFLLTIRPSDRIEQKVYKMMIYYSFPAIQDVPCTNSGKPIDPFFAREYTKMVVRYAGRKTRDKMENLMGKRKSLDREFRRVDEDFRAEPEIVSEILDPALKGQVYPSDVFNYDAIRDIIDEHYNRRGRNDKLLSRLVSSALAIRYFVHDDWQQGKDALQSWPENNRITTSV